MIRCKEVAKNISSDEDMTFMQVLELRLHFLICGPCRRFAWQIKKMGKSMKGQFEQFQVEKKARLDHLKERIKKKL